MKLSVCIPVYKVEAYIEKCARSLFEQTLEDMEFIFVDDCSPDGSIAKLREVLKDYPRRQSQIKIVRHEKNAGLIRARKTAMAAATGELITHCDSDDWIDRDLYEKMVARFDDPEVDMVFAPMVRNDDSPIKGMWDEPFEGFARDYFGLADKIVAFNSNVNKIYRREIAVMDDIVVPDHVKIGEDVCRTAQTVAHCRKVSSITGSVYHYRENLDSMTRKFEPRAVLNDLTDVYRVIAERTPEEMTRGLRVQMARNLAFYGLKLGAFDAREFRIWWQEMLSVSGGRWADGQPLKRRTILRIAGFCYPLARLLVRIVPNHKVESF